MATILVVEDEPAIRQLIYEILRAAGHTVITAANGFEGIALFRSNPDQYDLVLTDLQMPVMNGQEFIKLARETSAGTKIICMTGYTADAIPETAEFLQKPFMPAVLCERVNELLNRR
jgi:two-component system cell cycle sensor histidine kinase/response regulator CckA